MSRRNVCTSTDTVHLATDAGADPELAMLTDSEFRCFVSGVLAIAAQAEPRGHLLVKGRPACEQDIAAWSGTKRPAAATSAVAKLRAAGILLPAGDGVERVRHFDERNPPPPAPRPRYPSDERRAKKGARATVAGANGGVAESVRSSARLRTSGGHVEAPGNGAVSAESADAMLRSRCGVGAESATPSLPSPPPDPLPAPPTPAHAPSAGAGAHTREAADFGDAEPTAVERQVQDVLAVFAAIPSSSPASRLNPVDPFGVETAIAAHPDGDPLAAARAVIVRASDAAQTFVRAAVMLKDELERQATGRSGRAPSTVGAARGGLRALPGGRGTDPTDDWDSEGMLARADQAVAGAPRWTDDGAAS